METKTTNNSILTELWKVKDDISAKCNGDFKVLGQMIKKEASKIKKKYKFKTKKMSPKAT